MDYFCLVVIKSVLEIDYFSARSVIRSVTAEGFFVVPLNENFVSYRLLRRWIKE